MLKNIKAVIFDMDGTLIDSMWIWKKIDVDYLNNRNIEIPSSLKDDIELLSYDKTAEYFKTKFNLPDTIDEIKTEWENMAHKEYCTNVKLKPGAREFLSLLKNKGIKIALATSNCKLLLEAGLKSTNIYEYFDSITMTDEVSRGKNFPDVYLLAAEKLGVKPEECVVFEDILPAVIGAKAAGMKVVGVSDHSSFHQKDDIINMVDKFIDEYHELIEII